MQKMTKKKKKNFFCEAEHITEGDLGDAKSIAHEPPRSTSHIAHGSAEDAKAQHA